VAQATKEAAAQVCAPEAEAVAKATRLAAERAALPALPPGHWALGAPLRPRWGTGRTRLALAAGALTGANLGLAVHLRKRARTASPRRVQRRRFSPRRIAGGAAALAGVGAAGYGVYRALRARSAPRRRAALGQMSPTRGANVRRMSGGEEMRAIGAIAAERAARDHARALRAERKAARERALAATIGAPPSAFGLGPW
jgi:hypothetical protein